MTNPDEGRRTMNSEIYPNEFRMATPCGFCAAIDSREHTDECRASRLIVREDAGSRVLQDFINRRPEA